MYLLCSSIVQTFNVDKMIKYVYIFLLGLVVLSCGEEECCDIAADDTVLNYDGDNFIAPTLPPGDYVFAIRLPTTTLNRLASQSIKSVQVYMYDIPTDISLVIYNESGNLPSGELYRQNITSDLSANGWNLINLTTPFMVEGSTLWVGIDVDLDRLQQSVGCDRGPASPNGDWLYDSTDDQFIRFANRVNDSVNWNIRVTVGE